MNKKIDENTIPFSKIFGKKPPYYIDREELIDAIVDDYYLDYGYLKVASILCARGIGKTTLLKGVQEECLSEGNWVTVFAVNNDRLLLNIYSQLYENSRVYLDKYSDIIKNIKIALPGISFDINNDTGYESKNYEALIRSLTLELTRKDINVLFIVDEVFPSKQLAGFITLFSEMFTATNNICLLLGGLPDHLDEIINGKNTSFLARSQRFILEPLNIQNISEEYANIFKKYHKDIRQEHVHLLSEATFGNPYLFQSFGYNLFQLNKDTYNEDDIYYAIDRGKNDYFENVLSIMCKELTDIEKSFLDAMLDDVSTKVSVIKDKLDKTPTTINTYKDRLILKGFIQQKTHGEVKFAMPYLTQYLIIQQMRDAFELEVFNQARALLQE